MSETTDERVRILAADIGNEVKVIIRRIHESPPGFDIRWFDSERDRSTGDSREILYYRYNPFPGVEQALASLDADKWPEFDAFRDE